MKRTICLLLTVLPLKHLPAQSNAGFSARTIEKNMVKVDGTIYASRYEATNGDYRQFMSSIRANTPDSVSYYEVDTTAWRSIAKYQEAMVSYYYQHPAYSDYPVVNVPYEGAWAFCRWLTGLYNSDPKRKYESVEFFLPDTLQWMTAARGGRPYPMFPWNNYYLRDKEGRYLCNMKRVNELNVYRDSTGTVFYKPPPLDYAESLNDRAFYTAEVKSFYPNPFGIYNMSGNVAEMVAEKNISKGGSWNSYAYEVMIGTAWTYREPNPETGFRVFMRVIRD